MGPARAAREIVSRGGSSHGSSQLGSAAIVFPGSDLARLVIGSAKSSSARLEPRFAGSAIQWLAEPADLGSVLARIFKNSFGSARLSSSWQNPGSIHP